MSAPLPCPTNTSQLLSDTEMRRFLTDGYLILNADVPAEVHAAIYRKLQWILHEEGNPGNNILPAVPEMQQILDSPRIRGALASVLGPKFVLHPHRYVHNNEPGEQTPEGGKMGKGSHSFIGWHQDSHSPLARPRHHYLRYAMLLYYPQDTPIEMGPTQLIPATYLHRTLSETDYTRGFQAAGPAGTCVLIHFDIAHGGSLNIGASTRHMAKFVFTRTEEPTAPSWDCRESAWKTPEDHQAPAESTVVWTHLWDWLSGRIPGGHGLPCLVAPPPDQIPALLTTLETGTDTDRIAAIQSLAAAGAAAAPAVPALIKAFGNGDSVRQNAIYALATIGSPAVASLVAELAGQTESDWYEGAFPMEDSAYALAAIGEPAVPALIGLLDHDSEWVRINALFALGEMGRAARSAAPQVLAALRDPSHCVVRTALDALGQIGAEIEQALPELRRLLTQSNPDWQEMQYRKWTGENQVRMNAMTALLRLGSDCPEAVALAAEALNDPCGYVGGFGIEYLLRNRTPAGLEAALTFLQTHRWDSSLNRGIRTY